MTPRSKKARKQLRMLVRKGEPGLIEKEAIRLASSSIASTSTIPALVNMEDSTTMESDVVMGSVPTIPVERTKKNTIKQIRKIMKTEAGKPLAQLRMGGYRKISKTTDAATSSKMKQAGKAMEKIGGKVKTPDRRRF